MEDKYIMLNLDDDKTKKVAEVVSSSSCKKILNLLADKEASESDIARELGIPVNTAEYNIKKLIESGLIESVSHFWSVKGKKIKSYRLAKKYIVIAPKKSNWDKIKPILPVAIVSVILTFIIKFYYQIKNSAPIVQDFAEQKVMSAASGAAPAVVQISSSEAYATWFLIGALTAIVVFLIWMWRKS